jgi:hypothetical protein
MKIEEVNKRSGKRTEEVKKGDKNDPELLYRCKRS